MSDVVITTKDLTKIYQKTPAADRISMTLHSGDIYGLIGMKGAGKTTFVRMVCGLARPTRGEIELLGAKGGRALREARRQMGVFLEHSGVCPDLSAMENLEVQRRCLGLIRRSAPKEQLQELLELTGLEKAGKKKVRHFSLGMKRRLGIAACLVGSPRLIVLDEPTIGLDSEGIMELRSLLPRLNQEKGLTILFCSHNLSELEGVAARYGFLIQGKLVREFTAEELERDREILEMDLEKYYLNLTARLKAEERL